MNITFQSDQNFAVESPVKAVEGENLSFACNFWNTPSTVSALVYVNRRNVTSTVMPSGSVVISGDIATLKPMTSMVGGSRYVVAVTATVDAEVRVKKFMVIVDRDEREQ